MTMLAVAAIGLSTLFIVALCIGDPKRQRIMRASGRSHRQTTRRVLAAGAVLPGIGLALAGDAAAFLTWIGGASIVGWLLVQWASARPVR